MQVTAQHREGVTIIYPKGKITIGMGDVALRDAVGSALDGGATKILINFKGVSTADSSGVGEMVAASTTITNRGGALKLCDLPKKVTNVLRITQMIAIFDIFDTEDEAIGSF